jgi:hypothetical protein
MGTALSNQELYPQLKNCRQKGKVNLQVNGVWENHRDLQLIIRQQTTNSICIRL